MATISDCRAIYGLSAVGTPTSTGVDGTVTLGVPQTMVRLTDADVQYSIRAIFAGIADLALDITTGSATGSPSWVAGTAQVETATVTAASGITGSGNATVTVTASGMTGSPKAISVALTTATHTTATLIATAIAAALNADTDYSAMFTATSSGANVITTRKPLNTYTVPGGTLNTYAANDGTLNVAIANGTCSGITTAGTSANTTAGVASVGVKIYDGDGKDFEGVALPALSVLCTLFQNVGSNVSVSGSTGDSYTLSAAEIMNRIEMAGDTDLSFTASGASDLYVHIIGSAT